MSDNNQVFLTHMRKILHGPNSEVYLDDHDLASILLTFPACLIAAADGNVDTAERLFLLNVSDSLGDGDVNQSSEERLKSAERFRAFMWLLNERENYEEEILNAIKLFLNQQPDSKKDISNMMWGMAESSDGVSEDEKKEILRISEAIGINETLN